MDKQNLRRIWEDFIVPFVFLGIIIFVIYWMVSHD